MSKFNLKKARQQIDDLDKKILICILKRFAYVQDIKKNKKKHKQKLYDREREKTIFKQLQKIHTDHSHIISWLLVKKVFKLIIKLGKNI